MKLAVVRQRYTPFGGAERFVDRALQSLAACGVDISLLTRSWEGAEAQGFRRVELNPPYSRFWGGRAARDRSFSEAVQAEISRGGYDIVQSHERIPGCTLFRAGDGLHAAWLRHRGRVLSPARRLAQRVSPYHRYVLSAERAMFGHPALRRVICNSRMVADEVQHWYGLPEDQIAVIQNGVDTAVYHPSLADQYRRPWREQMGIPQGAPLLLLVGSGFERKGVPTLLRAFAALRRHDAHLMIVGGDRRLAGVRKLAAGMGLADRVHITGPLRDVRPCYGAADAFVLPSLYDPCPNAALEALASGLPVVTSNTCGAQEWIRPGVNGWVVDALDVPAMTQALERLCELAAQPAARTAARAGVEALTLEAMAQRLLGLYAELGLTGNAAVAAQ
jgi:UDP-glucose:(heptosyl)LPS alpha-1,3-glucosyltransferase